MIHSFIEQSATILSAVFNMFKFSWAIKGVPNQDQIEKSIIEKLKSLTESPVAEAVSSGRIRTEKRYDDDGNVEGIEILFEVGTIFFDDYKKIKEEINSL